MPKGSFILGKYQHFSLSIKCIYIYTYIYQHYKVFVLGMPMFTYTVMRTKTFANTVLRCDVHNAFVKCMHVAMCNNNNDDNNVYL